jgi:hypothetical protein
MTRRLALLRTSMISVLAIGFVVVTTGSAGADSASGPDLQVAVVEGGKCGAFADSLPVLFTRIGVRAGQTVDDVSVCVTNAGEGAGVLRIRIDERVEVDSSCSGDEADADGTCGGGDAGELGRALLQEIGTERCRRPRPPVDLTREGRLPDLESPVLLAERLSPGHLLCVRLVLRYAPADGAALVVSQSDTTSWRYAFDLSATR